MEYNTQRPQLKITDYGRHVAKMIEYAKTIEDRQQRNEMANIIVDTMAHVNPKMKERTDYKQTLWEHMMMMADYALDVDSPYAIHREEPAQMHPQPLKRAETTIRYRHYGRALEDMVRAVAAMPEGSDRDILVQQLAHLMKRQYLQWNRDSVEDEVIVDQLTKLSDGRIKLPADFQFRDSKIYIDALAAVQAKKEAGDSKKKKKKKKKQNQAQA